MRDAGQLRIIPLLLLYSCLECQASDVASATCDRRTIGAVIGFGNVADRSIVFWGSFVLLILLELLSLLNDADMYDIRYAT